MTGSPRIIAFAIPALLFAVAAQGQSLAPVRPSGQTVTPVYEGWYRNADGTYSLSFGYYNRNTSEVLSIPAGTDNFTLGLTLLSLRRSTVSCKVRKVSHRRLS